MVDATHIRFKAEDRSYFAILKKEIHQMATDAGFVAPKLADIDLVIAEMTSNLHKYGNGGEILAGVLEDQHGGYLELICLDRGPGMKDSGKMMADGTSTTSTLGMGLGSIKRLSDFFDMFSQKGWGTILLSRFYLKPLTTLSRRGIAVIKPLVLAMPGQVLSGDGTYYKITDRYIKLLVCDGLGHGKDANIATNEAVNAFKACASDSPAEILRYIHQCVKKTRGAVATVAIYDIIGKVWRIAGVGNISTRMTNFLQSKNVMSYNGILGHNIPNTINDHRIAGDEYQQIVLCSDGIRSRWDITKLLGLMRCDMSIQAAAIYKDYGRQTDDMSVVLAKINIK